MGDGADVERGGQGMEVDVEWNKCTVDASSDADTERGWLPFRRDSIRAGGGRREGECAA